VTEPNPPAQATTRDLGLAIRDALSFDLAEPFRCYVKDKHGDLEPTSYFTVDDVDVSDPHNPLVYITNEDGTCCRFRVRIVSLGGYE